MKLIKDSGFKATLALFIKDALEMPEDAQEKGIWLSPMGLYEEESIVKINKNDCSYLIEEDLNEVSVPLKWVCKVESTRLFSSSHRYDYRVKLHSVGGIDDDELITVLRSCLG